ncbi:MAG: 23S rRNA (uracil(1939)-C(5))-methyltransferase RlmD [Candidatus Gracilibacteria bacterium]|nr:23S rRNA (uracil(1939)-C(5))-methyltransferase RlmD [Candidatus Gracilibacteria bacterium]
MKKHDILERIFVEKLIFGGKGLAKAPDGKKIIITGGVIPESIVNLRILKIKNSYIDAQVLDVVKKSPLEDKLPDHFQVYGGCKWLPIKYEKQLEIKEEQVREALYHIREFTENTNFHKIVASPEIYGYRNKVEFSFGKYISSKEQVHDDFRFGFHKQGEFDRIINCSYCVLADDEINEIFKEVDSFSRKSGLPTYDPFNHDGFWRHFVVRKAFYTGDIMIIFSVNTNYSGYSKIHKSDLEKFSAEISEKFKNIKSVYILGNTGKADIVSGDFRLVFGKETIREKLFDFEFEINPKSFFQTNSKGAEVLYSQVMNLIKKEKSLDVALDLYAGTGTIGIILSNLFKKVYSVELVKEASLDGERNAKHNNVSNIEFVNAKVEDFLNEFETDIRKETGLVDLLIIDPPRDGMHPDALPNIIKFNASQIIYVSCNPSTLARDLDFIVKNSGYEITDVIPVDMFPHTHHIETVVRLELKK